MNENYFKAIEDMNPLLRYLDARLIRYDQHTFMIEAQKELPIGIACLAQRFNMSTYSDEIRVVGNFSVQDYTSYVSATYTFNNLVAERVKDLVFKATENERFKEFSNVVDKEITDTLSTSNK